MTRAEAKAAIIREWRGLTPEERATGDQAAVFALKAIQRYNFTSSGDRYQDVMGWLQPYVGRRDPN